MPCQLRGTLCVSRSRRIEDEHAERRGTPDMDQSREWG
eukprot:CAMPEP_0202737148 /NCGR_PEP_ID=MMETSP1388-20130828/1417_1 /ASSEMBLY_ACC=CAM_ASM_000864 /TAXON_ID=37098 /ORGANISM="Isochrysis sp, Strain CCMP1244" /LENGTH=37 /DNA_ID= /DNA_START= /DNA_END= /DNA_ORIENTATION=